MADPAPKRASNVSRICIAIVALIVAGVLARGISLRYLPNESANTILVTIERHLVAAHDIERTIAIPLEDEIATLDGLTTMRSISERGRMRMELHFADAAESDRAYGQLSTRIERLYTILPSDTRRPRIERRSIDDQPIFIVALPTDGLTNRKELERLFGGCEGAGQVSISGIDPLRVVIRFDRFAMAHARLTAQDIVRAIRTRGLIETLGSVSHTPLLLDNRFETLDDIKNLIVRDHQGLTSRRLEDIAQVVFQSDENASVSRIDGRRSAVIYIHKSNQVSTSRVARCLRTISAGLSEARIVYDYSRPIKRNLTRVLVSLVIGPLLIGALLCVLHEKPIIFGLLFGTLCAVATLSLMRQPLDLYAAAGIAIAQLLIIASRRPRAPTAQWHNPLPSACLMTIACALSLLIFDSTHNNSAHGAIIAALACLVGATAWQIGSNRIGQSPSRPALSIPALSIPTPPSRPALPIPTPPSRIRAADRIVDRIVDRIANRRHAYRDNHIHPRPPQPHRVIRTTMICAQIALILGAIVCVYGLPWHAYTDSTSPRMHFSLEFPDGTLPTDIERHAIALEHLLQTDTPTHAMIATIIVTIEREQARFSLILNADADADADRTALSDTIHTHVRRTADNGVFAYFGTDTDPRRLITLTVRGRQHDEIRQVANRLSRNLATHTEIEQIILHSETTLPAYLLRIDSHRATTITPSQVEQSLRWALSSPVAYKWPTEEGEIDVHVQANNAIEWDVQKLLSVPIDVRNEHSVPLAQVAHLSPRPRIASLSRHNRRPIVQVTLQRPRRISNRRFIRQVDQTIDALEIGPDTTIRSERPPPVGPIRLIRLVLCQLSIWALSVAHSGRWSIRPLWVGWFGVSPTIIALTLAGIPLNLPITLGLLAVGLLHTILENQTYNTLTIRLSNHPRIAPAPVG